MGKLFSRKNDRPASKDPIIIVSGLPRSGTSMMMRMLAEGGLPVVTDELRRADEDNPNGYFELEIVRQLKEGNVEWLQDASGKGVKIISALLEYLPPDYQYKIIFMERDARETLASQRKMLDHRGQVPKLDDEEMEQQFHAHLSAIKPWLVRQPNVELYSVSYNALMNAPASVCEQIVDFLELPLNASRMLAVPDQHLYRNRNLTDE
jgi:hypothetical protein